MRIAALTAFLLLLILPVAACRAEEGAEAQQLLETGTLVIESKDTGQKHSFEVELAVTPQQQMQGLMFRSAMPADHGMLFLFGQDKERAFWMKNTLIPLDMLFIRESGIIGHIHENAVPLDETPVPSQGPALNVLELNGGTAAKLGIKAGDIAYMDTSSSKTLAP